jgi:hypothetical protein
MSSKAFRLVYSVLLLLGISLAVAHTVRIRIGAEQFRYMSFFGPAMMCGLCCYQLYLGPHARRNTA